MLNLAKQLYHKFHKLNYKTLFILALSVWFLINVIQAITTGIIQDEAYYHFYSEKLAWGYFDHPPAVALMIKISSLFFSNALNVRFVTIILQLVTLVVIWKTIENRESNSRDLLTFFGISASVVMFVTYGFITTPDSPLLFFTALFLFSYKGFLKKETFLNCVLLAISMAGLIYSKYQGGLVIALVILSNPRLLTNYKFWFSGIAALILFSPHIVWQFENDFAPFKYHLASRSKPFKITYFLEYLPNQAANFNPFVLVIIGYVLYKFRSKDLFFKSLRYIIIGLILFFWGTTFRGHVEPQWTIAASIPIIITLFYYSKESLKVDNYLKKFLYPSIVILLLLRVVIAIDAIPLKLEFYNQDKWANNIKSIAGNRAVIFRDGYQKPSLYKYYAKGQATTINSIYYRQNQYDLYNYNHNFYNQKVMIVTDKTDSLAKPFKILKNDSIYVRFSDKLVLTSDIEISYNLDSSNKKFQINTQNVLRNVTISNRGITDIDFNNPEYPVSLHLVIFHKRDIYSIPVRAIRAVRAVRAIKAYKEVNNTLEKTTSNTLEKITSSTSKKTTSSTSKETTSSTSKEITSNTSKETTSSTSKEVTSSTSEMKIENNSLSLIHKNESIEVSLHFVIPDEIAPGEYKAMFSIKCGPFREGFNSKPQKVEIDY